MCFSSGARPAGIVIPVCCRIIEYQEEDVADSVLVVRGLLENACVRWKA